MNDEINQAMDKAFRLLMSAPTKDDLERAALLIEWCHETRKQNTPRVIGMGGHYVNTGHGFGFEEADE